jgi:hypothetical protein
MGIINAMSELDAVNSMLLSIGQAPVNTLNVSGITDVALARQQLTGMTRRVLSRGWNFNTDKNYQLVPDVDGLIAVPAGALKFEGMSPTDEFTQRRHPTKGMCVYDQTRNSFTFTAPVSLKVTWAFAFEDLPETARCYIATAAGRRFQSKAIGSQILDRFEEEDEMKALILMERDERGSRKTNMFRGNAQLAGFGSRRY